MNNFFAENKIFMLSALLLAGLVAGAAQLQHMQDAKGQESRPASQATQASSGVTLSTVSMHIEAPTTTTTIVTPKPAPAAPTPNIQRERGDGE